MSFHYLSFVQTMPVRCYSFDGTMSGSKTSPTTCLYPIHWNLIFVARGSVNALTAMYPKCLVWTVVVEASLTVDVDEVTNSQILLHSDLTTPELAVGIHVTMTPFLSNHPASPNC